MYPFGGGSFNIVKLSKTGPQALQHLVTIDVPTVIYLTSSSSLGINIFHEMTIDTVPSDTPAGFLPTLVGCSDFMTFSGQLYCAICVREYVLSFFRQENIFCVVSFNV